jgi:hypothetical protein
MKQLKVIPTSNLIDFVGTDSKKRKREEEIEMDNLAKSKLSAEKILKLFSTAPNSVRKVVDVEGFMFPYQKRSKSEDLFVQGVCNNFLQHYKGKRLHQKWNIITVIGGSGIGKSRFSYESWGILQDYITSSPEKCLTWLEGNRKIFEKFKEFLSPGSIIEVFIKETNGDQIGEKESIEYHLCCCLASCLLKSSPSSRDYVRIGEIKKGMSQYADVFDLSTILEAIRLKMKLASDKPLTILWRVDEVQAIDRNLNTQQVRDLKSLEEKIVNGNLSEEEKKQRQEKEVNDQRRKTRLYQYILTFMGFVCGVEGTSTFIVPICSGTSDLYLKEIMPRTFYSFVSVPLYISDISVDTASAMMEKELQFSLQDKIKNLRLYLRALGPVPRLVQYSCEFLKINKEASLKDLHIHLSNKIEDWYREKFTKELAGFVMIAMLEQWDLTNIYLDPNFIRFVDRMVQGGQFFLTPQNTLSMPLLFVEQVIKLFGKEWDYLHILVSNAIRGHVNWVDLEVFPGHFYAFKIHLYQIFGRTQATMEQFFNGAYMNEVRNIPTHNLGNFQEFASFSIQYVRGDIKKKIR